MKFAEYVFWGSLGLTLYAFAVYPIVLGVLSRLMPDSVAFAECDAAGDPNAWPKVTLLIAAYREESAIVERLRNAVAVDYPADRLEVLVGCDGEEDLTGLLVRSLGDPRVRVIEFRHCRGTASVLNDCVPQATGEIIVLPDADARMRPDTLRRLVRHFRRPEVGGVCGTLDVIDPGTGKNAAGISGKLERFLRRCEGRLGASLGVSGGIVAIRKELYSPLPANAFVDVAVIGMCVYRRRKRLLYDESAVAVRETPPSIGAAFYRRSRISTGGLPRIALLLPLSCPLRGRIAFAFWSHRVLRWLCPGFLIAAFVSNACLTDEPFYLRCLLVHESFYVIALVGFVLAGNVGWKRLCGVIRRRLIASVLARRSCR